MQTNDFRAIGDYTRYWVGSLLFTPGGFHGLLSVSTPFVITIKAAWTALERRGGDLYQQLPHGACLQ